MRVPTTPDAPATVKSLRLEGAAGELHGIELGRGRALLALHGVTAHAYVWLPVMERLSERYRVIAIDQRGHGRSGVGADGRYDGAAYAADVAAVVSSLGVGPVVIVGHSLGARNAVEAGARRPDLVAGVVAVDFTPYVEESAYTALEKRIAGGEQIFVDKDEVLAYLSRRYPGLGRAAIARRAEFGFAPSPGGGLQPLADRYAMKATAAGLRADLAPALAALAVPAVLVRGARSAFVSAAAFAAARRLRPDLRAETVEDADHYVPEEQPAAVACITDELASEAFAALGMSGRGETDE
jgi:2-(acetamidomethylene)succinate hydrolase